MTINELQLNVDNWISTIGVRYFNEMTNTLILQEEVGEFSRLVARIYGEQSFKKSIHSEPKEMLADELADIFFVLTCLANQMEINLEDAIDKNLIKKSKRDADRHKNNEKL